MQASVLQGACANAFLPSFEPVSGSVKRVAASAKKAAATPARAAATGGALGGEAGQGGGARPDASTPTAFALGSACWDSYLPDRAAGGPAASQAAARQPAQQPTQVMGSSSGRATPAARNLPSSGKASSVEPAGQTDAVVSGKADRWAMNGLAKTIDLRKARAKQRSREKARKAKRARERKAARESAG